MPQRRRNLINIIAATSVLPAAAGDIALNSLPLPPGSATDIAGSETQLIRILAMMAWPIFLAVVAGLVFTLWVNRVAPAAAEPGAAALRGNSRLQTTWIASSTTIVLGLAVFGTITLANDTTVPAVAHAEPNTPLEVQVIAQQWYFNYRYPSFGGFESAHLVIPADREIEFHVTSLDVTHSFWFFAVGVKADAVPVHEHSVDMQPLKIGTYRIECSELCGIWHGSMSDDNAQIVSAGDFTTWAHQQQQLDAPIMKYLPPYSHTYVPAPGVYGS